MGRPLSGHLWSSAILVIALLVAMLVDRAASASAANPSTAGASGMTDDIARFSAPLSVDTLRSAAAPQPASDPFGDARPAATAIPAVTGLSASPRSPQLTAVLIAEEGSVAVIDDEAVSVGGT